MEIKLLKWKRTLLNQARTFLINGVRPRKVFFFFFFHLGSQVLLQLAVFACCYILKINPVSAGLKGALNGA